MDQMRGYLVDHNKPRINSIKLTKAFEVFINHKQVNWKQNSDSERTYRQDIFPTFLELLGDLETSEIDKSHIVKYKNSVVKLPVNRRKIPEYKALSVLDILELVIPGDKQISNRTKIKYLNLLSSFLTWMSLNGYSQDGLNEPLKNVIKINQLPSEDREPYKDEDLKKLFCSKQYTQGKHKLRSHFFGAIDWLVYRSEAK